MSRVKVHNMQLEARTHTVEKVWMTCGRGEGQSKRVIAGFRETI